jgi:hypothetical protein
MEELRDSTKTAGAAGAGALAGVFLGQDVVTIGVLALAFAYASSLPNQLGKSVSSVGEVAAKAYIRARDINEEYDVLPKAKSAADTVFRIADNLDTNYGISEKIDEKLKLSEKVDKVKDKFDETKAKLTDKVDELTASATKSD